jgi:transposase-like protein
MRIKQERYSEEFKKNIAMLRAEGKTLRELQSTYGISETAISSWTKKYSQIK